MKWLFPFVTPLSSDTITCTKNFSYHDQLFPTAEKKLGIGFRAKSPVNLRTVVPGTFFVTWDDITDSDPHEFPDLLTLLDPAPYIPLVGDPEHTQFKVNIFLRPAPFILKELDVLLAEHGRGNIVGFGYSGISLSNLFNASDTIGFGRLEDALIDRGVLILDEVGSIRHDFPTVGTVSLRWNYFFNGLFSLTWRGGLALAAMERDQEMGFSVLTTRGYIDPIEFYSLAGGYGFYNDLDGTEPLGNITEQVFEMAPIAHFNQEDLTPIPNRYNEIISLSKSNYLRSPYINIVASQYVGSVPSVFRDIGGEFNGYDDPENKQKAMYLAKLHEIGDPGRDFTYSAIQTQANPYKTRFIWFQHVDWQNIFQLEALCEFYLNFHYPLSGGFPLNPDHPHYRRVNFDTDLIVERLNDNEIDEVSPTLPNGDPNSNYIPDAPYPKKEFPYITVCVDDFQHIGGQLEHGEQFHCKDVNDGQPRDKYQGMMFVIERFQTLDSNQGPVGYPRVIGRFPWTSHSSQRYTDPQKASSTAGNLLYIAHSYSGSKIGHNFSFIVGNSCHISMIPYIALPTSGTVERWGYDCLPGILFPLDHTVDPEKHAEVDANGKAAILFHRGFYGQTQPSTGSEGCHVSPIPKFYEFRELLVSNYLRKYDPDEENARYDLLREIKNATTQDESEQLWTNEEDRRAEWISYIDNPDLPKIRCLYFLIRPNEPNIR